MLSLLALLLSGRTLPEKAHFRHLSSLILRWNGAPLRNSVCMKLLKIFPLVALITGGLALGDGMAQGRGTSGNGGSCQGASRGGVGSSGIGRVAPRGGVGAGVGAGAGVRGSAFNLAGANQGGNGTVSGRSSQGRIFSGGPQAGNVQRALSVSGNGWDNRNHDHSRHDRNRDRDRIRGIGPTTFPQNFQNFGFDANYDTAYYRGGFRQTTSPFGIPATFVFQPTRRDQVGSFNGNDGRFNGRNDGFVVGRDATFPYFQGQVGGYRPFGTYGVNGPYTVPNGGVATAAVQSALFQRGYYRGPVDGFNGELTRSAIRNYQFQNGLPVTGQVDGYLLRSIRTSAAPWLR
jgi:hypothetical protein